VSRSGRGHVTGPLACYAEGFREDLLGQGYAQGSAAQFTSTGVVYGVADPAVTDPSRLGVSA
jgi:hypothetical protein